MTNELTANDLVVAFRNEFNETTITGMTVTEHNLLLAIIGKMKKRGSDEIIITFNEVKSLLQLENLSPIEITRIVNSLWAKVKTVDYKIYSGDTQSGGVALFAYLAADAKKHVVKTRINPYLEYFVNSFETGNYSSLTYKDFQSTKDKYGKLLYRLLIQWKSVGKVSIGIEELEYKLDIPLSYKGSAKEINAKIIKPAMKSVSEFFPGLKLKTSRTGRRITHYEFTFTPQVNVRQWDPSLSKKNKNKAKRKDVTPENKSVDELQEELQRMWEEKGLER